MWLSLVLAIFRCVSLIFFSSFIILLVLTYSFPFLFIPYLRDTLRCNLRSFFACFLALGVLLIFSNFIPFEHTAKSTIPKSTPIFSSVKFNVGFWVSTPTLIYQYLPSKDIRGL